MNTTSVQAPKLDVDALATKYQERYKQEMPAELRKALTVDYGDSGVSWEGELTVYSVLVYTGVEITSPVDKTFKGKAGGLGVGGGKGPGMFSTDDKDKLINTTASFMLVMMGPSMVITFFDDDSNLLGYFTASFDVVGDVFCGGTGKFV